VGAATGLVLMAAGFVHPFWRIGAVSYVARHSGLLHYLTASPIVVLTFIAAGAWIGGELRSGRITIGDPPDMKMPGLEE